MDSIVPAKMIIKKGKMMKIPYRKVSVIILLVVFAIQASAFDKFTWIDKNNHPSLFDKINTVFQNELKPDIPEKVAPSIPYFHKYIYKIGAFQDSYIVLIGYKEHKDDVGEDVYLRAFSYDALGKTKKEISNNEAYYQWEFIQFAVFESSTIPDIVFKYFDCRECEKTMLLSSFKYNPKERAWEVRIWPENDPDLLIGSDMQYGDDVWSYDCLYKIDDFISDKYADIAIRCRITGETTHEIKDELLLYTVQNGVAKKIKVKGKKNIDRITKEACKGLKSPLCGKY